MLNEKDNYRLRCAAALDRALADVPFYQSWRPLDPGVTLPAARRLAALPMVTKRDLRAHMPEGFVPRSRNFAAAVAAGEVELVTTSGTTEDRSSVVWHQPWWDASEHAAARLHPALARLAAAPSPPREAVLTTPLCGGNLCHVGELSMAERTLGRLLFLNRQPDPNAWTPAEMTRMLDELDAFAPELLEADPAYLAILARFAADQQRACHPPAVISLTYEYPARCHYRQIRRAFGETPLLSSYGSTETGHLLVECEAGRWHQNCASCHLDFEPLAPREAAPRTGRLLVTTLDHPWLALLRFDVGDLVRLAAAPCPCGRTAGLTVEAIEGRVRDLTFAVDGRAVTVGRLDDALGGIDGLLAYQLEQQTPARFLLRFTALPGMAPAVAAAALPPLRALYGAAAEIAARPETAIAAEQSGKYRLALTRFAWDPAARFAGRAS